jgi:nucleotide-binding universal stress UspA family protein
MEPDKKEDTMFILRKILLPVDFSDNCLGAGRYAKALAARFASQITVLHVVRPPHVDYGGPEVVATTSVDLSASIRATADGMLNSFLAEELSGQPVERVLLEGDAARQIVTYAHTAHSDLIIIPTHGYGLFRRFLVGSVVAKVLHDADCPVWTGVHLEEAPLPEALTLRRIVCAVNLGPHAPAVLEWARGFAAAFNARLTVLHVVAPIAVAVTSGGGPGPEAELAESAGATLKDLLARTGVTAETTVEIGDIGQTIFDYAARLPADLLVIGRGEAKGIVGRLRSHAYSIIRQSPCAVVSV